MAEVVDVSIGIIIMPLVLGSCSNPLCHSLRRPDRFIEKYLINGFLCLKYQLKGVKGKIALFLIYMLNVSILTYFTIHTQLLSIQQ